MKGKKPQLSYYYLMTVVISAILSTVITFALAPSRNAAEINQDWTGKIPVLIPGSGYRFMTFYPDRHGQVVGFTSNWLIIIEYIDGNHGTGIIYDNVTAWENVEFHLNTIPNELGDKWIAVDFQNANELEIPDYFLYPERAL